jgi:hypothetical protein
VSIISTSGWSPWLILASYYGWSVSWLAVEEPHTTKNVNRIHMISPNQVTPSYLRGSGFYLLLSDLRLPPHGQHLWNEASPIWADVGCRPPRRLGKTSKDWTSSILPWNHALYGGVSAVFGKLDLVTRTIKCWDTSWSFPRLPRRQLKPILSATMGGRPYKAPHEAFSPSAAESLTSTLWHGGDLLPTFGLPTFIGTPDFKSLSVWVQQ